MATSRIVAVRRAICLAPITDPKGAPVPGAGVYTEDVKEFHLRRAHFQKGKLTPRGTAWIAEHVQDCPEGGFWTLETVPLSVLTDRF